jgi:hypothetical protein
MSNFTKNDLGATVVYSLMVDDFIHNNFSSIESAEAYADKYLQYSDYIIKEHHLAPFNSMYKTIVNKLFNADRKYCRLVDMHQAELDLIECDSPKFYRTEDRQSRSESKAYDNVVELWEKLPKAEKYAFNKQYKKLFGYEAMAS